MSGSPYDPPQDDQDQIDVPPPPQDAPGAPPAEGPAIDQNPTQLGFPQRQPPPPQFIGYDVNGSPVYGYKPGLSPMVKLALGSLVAAVAGYAISRANSAPRRN